MIVARHHLPLCIAMRDPTTQAWADMVLIQGHELYAKAVAETLLEERAALLDHMGAPG